MGIRYVGAAFLLLTMTACGESSSPTAPTAASSCSVGVAPLAQSASASGGTYTASVMSTGSCQWTASAQAPWIAVGPGATGSGPLTYTVQPNFADARQSAVTVGVSGGMPVTLVVSQAGTTP